MTNPALLAAIAAEPDDDTRRLAYADWLDENGDAADRDRAELIRVQCELAKHPGANCGDMYCSVCSPQGLCDDCSRYYLLRRQEAKLNDAHPEWTQWPCPECHPLNRGIVAQWTPQSGYHSVRPCSVCNWSCDLFKIRNGDMGYAFEPRRITWDRGWPGWVHVKRVDEVVNLNQWGHEQNYRQCTPTPFLTALAQAPPWGVPLRGVIVEELEPHTWYGPTSWGWLLSSVHSGPSAIPDAVFYHIRGGNTQDTKQAAIHAAAAAFLEFGRRGK